MANLKEIRKRIGSIKNTEKITKAMQMVAAAKLRRAQAAVTESRPYAEKLTEVIEHLAERVEIDSHPLLRQPTDTKNAALLIISSDRGLCGGYNASVVKQALRFFKERAADFNQLHVKLVGRKANDVLTRRDVPQGEHLKDAWDKKPRVLAMELAKEATESFIDGEIDEYFVIYTRFKSAISQEVVLDRVLPLRTPEASSGSMSSVDYIYEPDPQAILDELLPLAVKIHLQRALLESLASEQGARMTAMDNATSNAGEMIDSLTLQYNRARQAAITSELIEIISGAEAL